jgi:SAM-dependent MidA family methyltransferase
MNIIERLESKLQSQSALSFFEFMQMALYDPEFGYYTTGLQQFGQDFVTAPQLTPLFAYSLAQQCFDILSELSEPILFEFGAGSGKLCCDLLTRLEQLNCLPTAYYILEVSGSLQAEQQRTITEMIPHLASKVHWLKAWPKAPFEGVILANEVLDAMPVHRFVQTQEALYEIFVGLSDSQHVQEVLRVCDNPRLTQHVKHCVDPGLFPYQSEINLQIDDWVAQCSHMLTRGLLLIIDYGFPRHEYYHPDRYQGTLMCHYQHHSHTDPFIHIGAQDITAHVDFTHVAEAGVTSGFSVSGFTSQAAFLLANDLLSLLNEQDPKLLIQQQQAIKILVQPSEMGELFKVIALTKAWDLPLRGFQTHDRRVML